MSTATRTNTFAATAQRQQSAPSTRVTRPPLGEGGATSLGRGRGRELEQLTASSTRSAPIARRAPRPRMLVLLPKMLSARPHVVTVGASGATRAASRAARPAVRMSPLLPAGETAAATTGGQAPQRLLCSAWTLSPTRGAGQPSSVRTAAGTASDGEVDEVEQEVDEVQQAIVDVQAQVKEKEEELKQAPVNERRFMQQMLAAKAQELVAKAQELAALRQRLNDLTANRERAAPAGDLSQACKAHAPSATLRGAQLAADDGCAACGALACLHASFAPLPY